MARSTTFERIRDETSLGQATRQPLLEKMEQLLKRRVVALSCSPYHPGGEIGDDDADMITEALTHRRDPLPVSLVLNSLGGSALGAERIVHSCRAASEGDFDVIVPGQAKSAATIVCLGAARIHMTPTAELGPIDPQFRISTRKGSTRWLPGHVIVKSYRDLMKKAEHSGGHIEPFMLQLDRYDAREVEDIKREIALSEKIAESLLKSGMKKGKGRPIIRKCLKPFLDPEITGSHGRSIFPGMAKECGLLVEDIPPQSAVWAPLWEYYWRATWAVSSRMPKLIETATSSMGLGEPSD